jgi:hypothetical protein
MKESKVASVAVNIGSQTNPEEHGRGPIYPDGSFEYVPITKTINSNQLSIRPTPI